MSDTTPRVPWIKGKGLYLMLPDTNYACQISSAVLDNEEPKDDVQTFCPDGSLRQFFFEVEAVQSTDPTSMWSYLWENSGKNVGFVYAPHGNEVPTAAQPHFTGTLTIGPPPKIGGKKGETYTFTTRWDVDGRPAKVTGAP